MPAVVIITNTITVAIKKMANYMQRNMILVTILSSVLLLMIYSVSMLQSDWNYFALEKQLNSWQTDSPPHPDEINQFLAQVKVSSKANPSLLRIQALALEWKAFIDDSNQRFYLYGAEESLQKVIILRPTDSQAWAHLALVKTKLERGKKDIDRCYQQAKRLGSGDQQTIKMLKRILAA